jgi:large subunit ribosomal protein L9
MKIILLQDVYKKGVAGEEVDVAPGYARNYLIPRGLAVKSSPGALRQLENLRKSAELRRAEREQEFAKVAEKIEGITLYFGVKAGETGKLYGSVTPAEIAERLKEELGMEIDHRRIGDRPLRELGKFGVPVRLDAGLAPMVQVVVHRESEDPREAEARADAEAAEAEAEQKAAEAEAKAAAKAARAEAEAETEAETEAEAGEPGAGEA